MKTMKAMKSVRAAPKSEIASQLADGAGLKKSDVMKVLDSLADIGAAELKKAGKFTLPGLVMIKTRKKKATKAGKKMMFGNLSVQHCLCFLYFLVCAASLLNWPTMLCTSGIVLELLR